MSIGGIVEKIKTKYETIRPYLNERTSRIWVAVEAISLGRGGITKVASAVGLSRTTIHAGINEVKGEKPVKPVEDIKHRIRKPGGGRKKVKDNDPGLLYDLESLLEPVTRGDPGGPLRWTCKSTTKLAAELRAMGHQVGQRTVCDLLYELGYSLQSNRKVREGSHHPDRNAQFLHISETTKEFQALLAPVISVDSKKRELIGNFKNNGREWSKKGSPVEVNSHDFPDPELGKVVLNGTYDITANQGWVSVGITSDTASFAVESIRRWWQEMGKPRYPEANQLLITADCGGSNSNRGRLWKLELQKLADDMKMAISVCHFPPGTSKWNKIEHRMFCHISQNWRGRPLVSREVVVNLIGSTTTSKGLKITAKLDENTYETGISVSDEEFDSIAIEKCNFHEEWNYKIKPRIPP
jgi:transposase